MDPETQPGVVPQQPAAPAPVMDAPPQAPQPQAQVPAQAPQDGLRDKTREQFEKLLDSNRRLFEENERMKKQIDARTQSSQVFAPVQTPPTAPRQVPQVNAADFVEYDPVTGEKFINETKLNQKIATLEQQASQANQAVQSYIKTSEQREVERQNREAFTAHPELDPNAKTFDAGFSRQVRGILFDSMYNAEDYGGRPLSFKEAADFVRTQYPRQQAAPAAQPTAEQQQKAEEGRDLKEQSTAHVQSQPQNAPAPTFDEDLMRMRRRTQLGDTEALARRIINTDHILKREG